MSKTAVKQAICDVCGEEVRDGSVFCFNCGSAVSQQAEEPVISMPTEELPTSDARSNGNPAKETVAKPRSSSRTRPRKRTVQTRDFAWEERDSISISFVVTTLVLVALAATILIAGFYLR